MKMTKMALLAGAALAVTTAGAKADDLDALKAQIESLNARVAAMETAPSVPAGYQLIAVSEGELQAAPGLGLTARERAAFGNKATIISVLPTADAPAGATISWSGYARAGLVYSESKFDESITGLDGDGVATAPTTESGEFDDLDVPARGQIRVKAKTDTAVGEVGVDVRVRGTWSDGGNGAVNARMDVAWGYWAMTPELTFGGGYAGSLGNIGYGYDGACSCYYTDNADLAFNPGDVTQMRLSYASGPLSFAVALEDGDNGGKKLGAAGEIKYSGDMISGEISGVWRDLDASEDYDADEMWQIGAGLGLSLGDMVSLSLAAAMGHDQGGFDTEELGDVFITASANDWWGVTALASVNLSDEIHAELAGGYRKRDGETISASEAGFEYETWGVMAGLYYEPVDQLTIGLEGEFYKAETDFSFDPAGPAVTNGKLETETMSVNLVSVWRF
jgi:hypothetical protein